MVLCPALPKRPAAGMVNAIGLKNPTPLSMGSPVASARPLPTAPVPPWSDRLPSTCAVNGAPERMVVDPFSVQFRNSGLEIHPPRPRRSDVVNM